ncbi:MAG: type I DNA topoisomerase [Acidobacteria bacterium]|nr:MAG: type I DNA topoisomerase [Acidobacteriota bacterium]REJ99203.1 MAG: type I DNA topoisomerase [Acidobacteriota bacterium]REK16076.1 MAG: type I DNA topoisomerase [Acidobacteriota bacterium]REK43757.1 MAG: type I DNA topoisomerase [Acidobacteriota bacterium]
MSKNLVIVESPAKAKTINKYLGPDYKVMASIGHIKDLPSKELGVDVDNDFEPTYVVIPDARKRNNKKTVSELKKAAKLSEAVYLAADPDREGEAICQHLAEELVPKKSKKSVYRVMFNEITKKAVEEAFKSPKQVNHNLVDAQQARRVLDRLVGYKVSPILWKTIGGRLSAGRVQTVAVRLVVEREREIEAFNKTEYWSVIANLAAGEPPRFESKLRTIDDKKVKLGKFDQDLKKNEVHVKNEEEAKAIVEEAGKEQFVVEEVARKERKRNPTPPFITSKLQQDASRRLGFSVKKTMTVAQKLYEGKEIGGDGATGLITYMRTDSTRISNDAMDGARSFIGNEYGDSYLPEKPRYFKSKKDAQDAHEAIRPTDVKLTPDAIKKYLSSDELKLYTLIWQRFVASQMKPALFDQTTIDIKAGRYGFRSTGSVLKFDGFLKVYEEAKGSSDRTGKEDDEGRTLPKVEKGDELKNEGIVPNQHFTEPPPRYSEATLVKALEELGIGRPSTYAAIMTTIQNREYVEKIEGRFHPTALGTTVNDLLVESFDDLFNTDYTARMEDRLDEIEEGKLDWREAIKGFYERFSVDLKEAEENIKGKKRQAIPTDEVCEKCGAGMVIKFGRYGQFLACENYPECKNTREVASKRDKESDSEEEGEVEIEPCELCGKEMSLKRGRFGAFYGCTGYPECKNIRKIPKGNQKPAPPPVELDEECPKDGAKLVRRTGRFGEFVACSNYPKCRYVKQEKIGMDCTREGCGGDIVIKKSRRGKQFYGCSEYPDCDVVFWNKPVFEKCPDCGAAFVLEKTTKRDGTTRYCNNEECDFKRSVEEQPADSPSGTSEVTPAS